MRRLVIVGVFVSGVIAAFVSPFASSKPDGLERVAQDHGFLERGEGKSPFVAPMADYRVPFVHHESVGTALAGFAGVVVMFGVMYAVSTVLRSGSRRS